MVIELNVISMSTVGRPERRGHAEHRVRRLLGGLTAAQQHLADAHADVQHLLHVGVGRNGRADRAQQVGRGRAAPQEVLRLPAHHAAEPARQATHTASLTDADPPRSSRPSLAIDQPHGLVARDAADGGEPHIRRPFGSWRNQSETRPMTPAMIR